MLQVWFLFKIIETVLGIFCILYHIAGFSNEAEPIEHIMLFCGTFFGFTLLSLFTNVSIIVGAAPQPLIEGMLNVTAAVFYFISSIVSMHLAENDFHLMYLSDFEEPLHPYFKYCRAQSICALAAGSMHLLHAILAFDAAIIRSSVSRPPSETRVSGADSDSGLEKSQYVLKPIRLYFLGAAIENKLRRFKWFDRMCSRGTSDLSVLKMMKSARDSRARRPSSFISETRYVRPGLSPMHTPQTLQTPQPSLGGAVPWQKSKITTPKTSYEDLSLPSDRPISSPSAASMPERTSVPKATQTISLQSSQYDTAPESQPSPSQSRTKQKGTKQTSWKEDEQPPK